MIQLKQVSKNFKDTIIFENVSLTIQYAGIHAILGESGSGKSTFLNMLAGYEPVSSGEIIKEGIMATIFQNYELIPELTVRENIYLAHEIKHMTLDDPEEILTILGLNDLLEHYPNELSGGQKQRVGIARALFQDPNIILCDEPTESLDIENKQIVMDLFQRLSKDHIILMATHDQKIVDQYADVIYRIIDKQIEIETIHDLSEKVKVTTEQKADKQKVSFYLKKILRKNTLIFSLAMSLFVAATCTLYGMDKKLFQPFLTFDSVTKDQIYIQSQYSGYDFNELGLGAKSLLEFNSLSYEKENYRFLTVPYIENELEIDGTKPEGLEIIVNQNVIKRLGEDCIGNKVTLKYQFDWRYQELEMVISGIIYENDIEREVVYYDEKALNLVLSQQTDDNGTTYLEKLQNDANYFVVTREYEDIDSIYDALSSDPKFMIESPLYDERVKEERQKQVYQVVFQVAELFMIIGIIMTVFVYSALDTKKYMRNCSILIALGVSTTQMRSIYFKVKCLLFTFIYFVFITIQQILFKLFADYQMTSNESFIMFLGIMSIYLIYLLVLFFSLQKLKTERINTLLKNGLDT